MEKLYDRYIAYISQKKTALPESHLVGLAESKGYSCNDIEISLQELSTHEYVIREEWYKGRATFQWVKDLVEFNRARPCKKK